MIDFNRGLYFLIIEGIKKIMDGYFILVFMNYILIIISEHKRF